MMWGEKKALTPLLFPPLDFPYIIQHFLCILITLLSHSILFSPFWPFFPLTPCPSCFLSHSLTRALPPGCDSGLIRKYMAQSRQSITLPSSCTSIYNPLPPAFTALSHCALHGFFFSHTSILNYLHYHAGSIFVFSPFISLTLALPLFLTYTLSPLYALSHHHTPTTLLHCSRTAAGWFVLFISLG